MASKHSSKSRRARRESPAPERESPTPEPELHQPSRLSPALVEAIAKECRRLQQAQHTLGCLALALQEGCEPDSYDDPDYSDVARAVRLMVQGVAERLEIPVLLEVERRQVSDE